MSRPEAVFDCLFITGVLQRHLGNAAKGEIHLFAYLACLLSIYSGRPANDWAYDFAGVKTGAPFSPDLEAATQEISPTGLIWIDDEFMALTESGQQEVANLSGMSFCSWRILYLEASCCSVLTLPVGIVRNALSQEPNLKPVSRLHTSRRLLDRSGLELLHEQFSALRQAIGSNTKDLLVPATVWLAFLSQSAKHADFAENTQR